MNILLSCPNDGASNNYIVNALDDLGHKVFFVDHRNLLDHCKKHVPQYLANEKIDMMLVLYLIPGKTYDIEYIRKLKANYPSVKYVSWIFDATMDGQRCDENSEFVRLMKEYDYFFTVCGGQVESFRRQGVNAYFGQEGVDSYVGRFNVPTEEKKYDVSFLGSVGHPTVHKERLPFLMKVINRFPNTLIGGALHIYDEGLLKSHLKRPTYNDVEHSKIVGHSKINLGFNAWPDIDKYLSARAYRVMGAGGFYMTKRSQGVENFYVDGKEIVLYDDVKDCLDKIRYYLDHDEEREEIAEAGRAKTMAKYTFKDTLAKMIVDIQ